MNHGTRRTKAGQPHADGVAGFTLLEILIVLAIVAVLAAILLAVVGRVRENGRSADCQTTLRQLALAVQQYVQDSDGLYPGDRFQRQLHPYIKSSGFIVCPTYVAQSVAITMEPDSHFYILGYYYNGVRLNSKGKEPGRGISFTGRHEANNFNPSTTWVFGDGDPMHSPGEGGGGFLAYTNCGEGEFGAKLHNGGGNYSFLDGHVKWLDPAAALKVNCATE